LIAISFPCLLSACFNQIAGAVFVTSYHHTG
jgi:hypothetical protein